MWTLYLQALEVGFDGVVLHTENTAEIAALRVILATFPLRSLSQNSRTFRTKDGHFLLISLLS